MALATLPQIYPMTWNGFELKKEGGGVSEHLNAFQINPSYPLSLRGLATGLEKRHPKAPRNTPRAYRNWSTISGHWLTLPYYNWVLQELNLLGKLPKIFGRKQVDKVSQSFFGGGLFYFTVQAWVFPKKLVFQSNCFCDGFTLKRAGAYFTTASHNIPANQINVMLSLM